MSNRHKLTKAIHRLTRNLHRLVHSTSKAIANWLLRGLLLLGRQRWVQAGFVLPTTVLLLLVLTLTVGSIGYRTFTRAQQTIGQRQQQVIYNAATPVIDRAKAKLAYLFDARRDNRLPGGIPGEAQLLGMLYNQENGNPADVPPVPKLPAPGSNSQDSDAYRFPDETRVNLPGGGEEDNAWTYEVDLNNDGEPDADVVYSILFSTPQPQAALKEASLAKVKERANLLQVRNGPLSNPSKASPACQTAEELEVPEGDPRRGWFQDPVDTSVLRKNFQVDVLVVPRVANGTVTTLEFQQDRQLISGNRWGAWFRNDLEIFPQPGFKWNGAMHTEGNLFVFGGRRNGSANDEFFHSYLISAKASCFYNNESSVVSVAQNIPNTNDPDNAVPPFTGQFISGTVRDNAMLNSSVKFHLFDPNNPITGNNANFRTNADSVAADTGETVKFALDPVVLQTQNISQSREIDGGDSQAENDPDFEAGNFAKDPNPRLRRASQEAPYLDDFYRADNRCGPKPEYNRNYRLSGNIGDASACLIIDLTNNTPVEETQVGLDGYWERRARFSGLRLIVGQRLELGDPAGWGGLTQDADVDDEPLRPWDEDNNATPARAACPTNMATRCHEARQRKSLWDNLAAVQSTLVYHTGIGAIGGADDNRDVPDACIVTTVHPGTPGTLENSATFENLAYGVTSVDDAFGIFGGYTTPAGVRPVISDFFRGIGTNGWEFNFYGDANVTTNVPLMAALQNLAYFAGDRDGGAPSFEPLQTTEVHPYPSLAMWGDFSNLRNIFDPDRDGVFTTPDYATLSPADRTTLHTAACTLGMLAYNLDYLEKFNIDVLDSGTVPLSALNYAVTRNLLGYASDQAKPANWTYGGLRGAIRSLREDRSPLSHGGDITLSNPIFPGGANAIGSPIPELDNLVDNPGLGSIGSNIYDNPEVIVRLLEQWRSLLIDTTQIDDMTRMINLAKLIITKEQVARDRFWGFQGSDTVSVNSGTGTFINPYYSTAPFGHCSFWASGRDYIVNNAPTDKIQLDPNSIADYGLDDFDSSGTKRTDEPLGVLCSRRPRYPILHSLFPIRDGAYLTPVGTYTASTIGAVYASAELDEVYGAVTANHPEQFVNAADPLAATYSTTRDFKDSGLYSTYIQAINPPTVQYQVVRPADIALQPKRIADWLIPNEAPGITPTTPNSNQGSGDLLANYIRVCRTTCTNPTELTYRQVAFKDTAPYDGRESMATRMLNVDLEMLQTSRPPADSGTEDWWLPVRGVVYAFREDAVAEDEIVRPSGTEMQAGTQTAYESIDPPLNSTNKITSKPVDYVADPDRRPYGFRLINGVRLDRVGDNFRGLSFISDNPVFIQGDFNLHRNGNNIVLEEFEETLAEDPDYDEDYFYNERVTLNPTFARQGDRWRPSEVLADAVTIISENFCDGSILDTFTDAGETDLGNLSDLMPLYDCNNSEDGGATTTSYRNQNLPSGAYAGGGDVNWARTNIADSQGLISADLLRKSSPIYINLDGNPVEIPAGSTPQVYSGGYNDFDADREEKIEAALTEVNSIIVSGIVPSRASQSYGGLHNFPRFLENWKDKDLRIAGAFLQLNFSKQATGPYDQDAWEPGTVPVAGEKSEYYNPPRRLWGYDVGLQYAPAGPIAQRFVSASFVRSEFYSEPPANDPYIRNLCLALQNERPAINCPPEP
jgi:hypothetical protein